MALLEIRHVKKSFGRNTVHQDISFCLEEGEKIAILGKSGTGKSVLLRSIIGLEKIDSGEILFKGSRIDNLSEEELTHIRKSISYSFQNGALFDSINVFENLAFPLFEHTNLSEAEVIKKVKEMLELVDLPGRELLMPSDLSGGMQKRVGMARSIMLSPQIVLFDEPTAGLDPHNSKNIVEVIKKFQTQKMSSLFITHDIPAAIDLCQKVCIIDRGLIGFFGTTEDFLKADNLLVNHFKMFL
jgi:phospholipid/cholesterol/gamma-HCH transport system ATP-binding protein